MAKGGARPGAGRRPKPLSDHLLAGTYRPDRHGPLASNVVRMPDVDPGWMPANSDVDRLSDGARLLLADAMHLYRFDALEGRQLMAALRSFTRIEQMEIAVEGQGVTVEGGPHPLLPALAREQRVFLAQWAALRLEK